MIIMMDVWLPKGYSLIDGSKIKSMKFSGEAWQIYETDGSCNILVTCSELGHKWCELGFLDASMVSEIMFGAVSFLSISSSKKYALIPVESDESPNSKVDAIAFSLALRESRKISCETSFHDAIYLEQFSRLLPTWTLTPTVEDEVVLGTWLTGGVSISTKSFRRLCNLTGWLSNKDLTEIIQAAELSIPNEMNAMSGTKTQHKTQDDPTLIPNNIYIEPPKIQTPSDKEGPKVFKLPGRPQLENFFNEYVVDIIFNAEKYQALGIEFPSAIVLYGPPGCGKTFAVERLTEFIDWPSYSIDSNSIGSPYIHETSKKIAAVFDKAIETAPSIIVIDEMEAFLSDRRSGGPENLYHVEEVTEFLRRIPEAINNKVLVIAMTNLIEQIDPAVLRRGRFDHVIEVGMPSKSEIIALVNFLLSKLPKDEGLDIEAIADGLEGKALSDSAFVIRESARLAAKYGKTKIDQESIIKAMRSLPEDKTQQTRRIGLI